MMLLSQEERYRGLSVKTPLSVLPDDLTPEWSEARATLEAAFTALAAYDGEHDDFLSESWERIAESKERAYVSAIQNGGTLPKRPKGGHVAEAADKRPAIVGEWFRLKREKDAADAAAWKVLVAVAPLAIPDAHAEIETTGEVFKAAEEAAERARGAFVRAFSHRRDLEQFSRGTDSFTGSQGLPQSVSQNSNGARLPATMVVSRAIEWLDTAYGPADTSGRLPAMRKVRSRQNGTEVELPPGLARTLEKEGQGIEYIDGFPPESQITRTGAARMEVASGE